MPEAGEAEIVRHYIKLSKMNFGVDDNMYPLGSCTMKYNPKVNEKFAKSEKFAALHPFAKEEYTQGALKVIYDLSEYFRKISGMEGVTLIPSAGSHGELTGVMIIKKYFEDIGEKKRYNNNPRLGTRKQIRHPLQCAVFKIKEAKSTPEGDVDIDLLREMLDENVAGMMLTSPGTTGLF